MTLFVKKKISSLSLAFSVFLALLFLLATVATLETPRDANAFTEYTSLSYQMNVHFTYNLQYSSNSVTETIVTTSQYTFSVTLDKSYGAGSSYWSLGCSMYPCSSIQGTYTAANTYSGPSNGCPASFATTGTISTEHVRSRGRSLGQRKL